MRRNVWLLVIAIAVLSVVGSARPVAAQDVANFSMPFSFTVGNRVMPAGKYEIEVTAEAMLTLRPEKGAPLAIPVITRLALQNEAADARFVFDKVENNYFLSEVWLPTRDGYLLHDTKQPHTHHVVKGEKKKRT